MQYSCREFENNLCSQSYDQIEETAFLAHLESCTRCRNLVELDEPLEDALRGLLPLPAPEEIFKGITSIIADYGKKPGLGHNLIKIGYSFSVILLAATSVLACINRKMIYSGILSLNTVSIKLLISLKQLGKVDQSVLSVMEKITASPFLISGLSVLAVLIWGYSIKQIREISK
jgi:hypothetical protein